MLWNVTKAVGGAIVVFACAYIIQEAAVYAVDRAVEFADNRYQRKGV